MTGILDCTVTIGRRANLDLDPLVITTRPANDTPWWLPEDGISEPGFSFRTTLAPESAYLPGDQPLAAVLDASTLPLIVYAKAVPGATLAQVKAVLELAVAQWHYNITVSVAGDVKTYVAYPSWPQWSGFDSGMVGAEVARCNITIPINPVGA